MADTEAGIKRELDAKEKATIERYGAEFRKTRMDMNPAVSEADLRFSFLLAKIARMEVGLVDYIETSAEETRLNQHQFKLLRASLAELHKLTLAEVKRG